MRYSLTINGKLKRFDEPVTLTLLELLNAQGFWSVRKGCEQGTCGSCAVIVDGTAASACRMLAIQAQGKTVETYEGIDQTHQLAPVKEVLMDFGDSDCGYCIPGMMMAVKALLQRLPDPTEEELLDALSGNFCHCTSSVKPVRAILNALKRL
jgi:aerobic-type carbon monoxide dehydrogenase small subunit (CoxS/CutS family)